MDQRPPVLQVLLVQLGSPQSPSKKDIRHFLKEFLSDRRVIDVSPWIWQLILRFFILPFRPQKIQKLYQHIWQENSFPLVKLTNSLAAKIQSKSSHQVHSCFLIGKPNFSTLLDEWEKKDFIHPQDKWLIIPQFPQYCEATTASVMDQFFKGIKAITRIPAFEIVTSFFSFLPFFFDGLLKTSDKRSREEKRERKKLTLFSLSVLPLSNSKKKNTRRRVRHLLARRRLRRL